MQIHEQWLKGQTSQFVTVFGRTALTQRLTTYKSQAHFPLAIGLG